MKNYTELDRSVNVDNIFIKCWSSDFFESGRSLTLGLDYKEKVNTLINILNLNWPRYKIKRRKFYSKTSTLNRKQSNIFGRFK